MTIDLADIIDAGPPADTESERLYLSAVMLTAPADRGPLLAAVSPADFHDPFYAWLYAWLRIHSHHEIQPLLDRLYAAPKPDWIAEHLGWWLACLLYTRSGRDVSGDPRKWRLYVSRIKHVSRLRTEHDSALRKLVGIYNECRDAGLGDVGPVRERIPA
jgi:hypothetical protein